MSTFMDLLFSLIFGGMLFMIVMTANDIASEDQTVYHGDMMVQEMLTSTVQMVEGELRNMGFGVAERRQTVMAADTSSIAFLCDIDRNGTPDTITYSLGSTDELAGTQNDRDRYLYRRVGGGLRCPVGTVTVFRLHYLTVSGDTLPCPVPSDRLGEVHVVEVNVAVENPYAPSRPAGQVQAGERDALFSTSLWQQTRLASQNLRR